MFQDDLSSYERIASKLGIPVSREKGWARHPLAFLVEAADDICYRVVDLEDGFRLGLVSFTKASELLLPIALTRRGQDAVSRYQKIRDDRSKIEYLRAQAINTLVHAAIKVFRTHHEDILREDFKDSLVTRSDFAGPLRKISDFSRDDIYSEPNVVQIEAAGYEVLGGLLEKFVPALLGVPSGSAVHDKVRELVPPQYRATGSAYQRLLAATDHVSGMTDSYAVTQYRRLRGIELPRR